MEPTKPISPELLAAKIEKIQNFEFPDLLDQFQKEPQLLSLLWFLQFVSHPCNYAGGLSRFTEDLVASESDNVGTATSTTAKAVRGRFELAAAKNIFRELPRDARSELLGDDYSFGLVDDGMGMEELLYDCKPQPIPEPKKHVDAWNACLVKKLTLSSVRRVCLDAARRDLADYFKQLCEHPHVGIRGAWPESANAAPWYFTGIADALLAFISRRGIAIQARIAETEITKIVTRWIRKSRNTKEPVLIIGSTRFGKSEAIKAHADSAPGTCRRIEVPPTNSLGDLWREIAKTLGLEPKPGETGPKLRERIDYVLRFSQLQLIMDEAQRLVPLNYSRNTSPARLEWVRGAIIDRGISTVFVATPQFESVKRKFAKATGFVMEQFDGRVLRITLPEELSEADLLAAAKVHFPDLRDEYLQFVVDNIISTERNFLSDLKQISLLAYDNAHESGRRSLILTDIKAAMAEVLPTTRTASPVESVPAAAARKPRCRRSAKAFPAPRKNIETLQIPSRETRPAMIGA